MKGLCGPVKVADTTPRKCELKDVGFYDEELSTVLSMVVIDKYASGKLGLKEGRYPLRQFRKDYNRNGKKCLDSGAIALEVEKKSTFPGPIDKWSFSVTDESKNFFSNFGFKSLNKDVYGNSFDVHVEFEPGSGRLPGCKILKARLNGVKVGLRLKSYTTDEAWDCVNNDVITDSSGAESSQTCSGTTNEELSKSLQKEREDLSKVKSKLESEKNELSTKLEGQKKDFSKERDTFVKEQKRLEDDKKRLQEQLDKLKTELDKAKNEISKGPSRPQQPSPVRRSAK